MFILYIVLFFLILVASITIGGAVRKSPNTEVYTGVENTTRRVENTTRRADEFVDILSIDKKTKKVHFNESLNTIYIVDRYIL